MILLLKITAGSFAGAFAGYLLAMWVHDRWIVRRQIRRAKRVIREALGKPETKRKH